MVDAADDPFEQLMEFEPGQEMGSAAASWEDTFGPAREPQLMPDERNAISPVFDDPSRSNVHGDGRADRSWRRPCADTRAARESARTRGGACRASERLCVNIYKEAETQSRATTLRRAGR
eukprot:COSAG06_NODE_2196_length_7375_cov_4.349643_5_plen_120_part_00